MPVPVARAVLRYASNHLVCSGRQVHRCASGDRASPRLQHAEGLCLFLVCASLCVVLQIGMHLCALARSSWVSQHVCPITGSVGSVILLYSMLLEFLRSPATLQWAGALLRESLCPCLSCGVCVCATICVEPDSHRQAWRCKSG